MVRQKEYPEKLQAAELDAYLSQGWFRNGQTLFTSEYLCVNEGVYSLLWMRLHLHNYQFKKRHRKLLRANRAMFTLKINKASITPAKESLYKHQAKRFGGFIASDLQEYLLDGSAYSIFETYEIAVYHGNKLVAVSFFDLGKNSLASIMGLYHPDYAKYSLGFYTMLEEISYATNNGFDFYYPGYVVPDYPRFDYKLRVGTMQHYNFAKKTWCTPEQLQLETLPIKLLKDKLQTISHLLDQHHIPNKLYMYPMYESGGWEYGKNKFLRTPLFISCFPNANFVAYLIIEYNIKKQKYIFSICSQNDFFSNVFIKSLSENYDMSKTFMSVLSKIEIVVESDSPETITKALINII